MQNIQTIILGLLSAIFVSGCAGPREFLSPRPAPVEQKSSINSYQAVLIPSKCSAEVLRPAIFRDEPLKVLVYDGSASYSNIPAEMVWNETRIQVEPARYEQEIEPAQYEEIEEVIETERARSELYAEPAKYKTVVREILIKPEHKRWKEGCLASSNTQCIETIPAEYNKIPTEVIEHPALIHQRTIPAKTIKLKRKKLIKAGKGLGQPLPARYETVRINRITKPWKIISSLVQAQYDTLTTTRKLRDEQVLTMPAACTETLSKTQILQLQRALNDHGHSTPLSGVLDESTVQALQAFQLDNKLAVGAITLETLRKLGLA
jgi:hypothetical protein